MRFLLKLALMAVAAAGLWVCWAVVLPAQPRQEQFLLLRPGSSTRHMAEQLRAAGVIHSSTAFLVLHYVGKPQTLKAGEYKFDRPANLIQVHDRLVRGDIYKHTVTIPEGFNIFDIAAAVELAGLGPRKDFLAVARSGAMVADIDPHAQSLEGYLFPDTYEFTRTQTMTDIATVMVRHFRQEARRIGLLPEAGDASRVQLPAGADVHRVVTMASIVEKETAAPEERPLVASVYYNRLAKNIALDADPSVIYAALLADRYQGSIYQSDLESDSPYNTYRHAGLPPGPIANPGRDALKAALHPTPSEYFYFVSDNNGHHRFARTLDEHARNVAAYRRALANQNR